MKKIRKIKIRFQANELLIVRRGGASGAQSDSAQTEPAADSGVSICPLCHAPLTSLPAPKEMSGAKDIDRLNEAVSFWKKS